MEDPELAALPIVSPLAFVNNGKISTGMLMLCLCCLCLVHMQVEEDGGDNEQRGHKER